MSWFKFKHIYTLAAVASAAAVAAVGLTDRAHSNMGDGLVAVKHCWHMVVDYYGCGCGCCCWDEFERWRLKLNHCC